MKASAPALFGELFGIAHVAQAREFDALHDAAGVHVETGNDAASERHRAHSRKLRSTREPTSPDFSG